MLGQKKNGFQEKGNIILITQVNDIFQCGDGKQPFILMIRSIEGII